MAVYITADKCEGCSACLPSCLFGALSMQGGVAVIDEEKCTGCGACIEACPFQAIASSDGAKAAPQPLEGRDVWVFAERTDEGRLASISAELLGVGRCLADARGQRLCAVLPGENGVLLAQELFAWGADHIYQVDSPLLAHYSTDAFARVITDLAKEHKPEILLLGATNTGRDLAPRVAARLGTGLTADCTALQIDSETGLLLQTRPAFGGNIMATIVTANHRPQMATVRPGVMEKGEYQPGRQGTVQLCETSLCEADIHVEIVKVVREVKKLVDLQQAEVIVAGGRGMGGEEGFALLRLLAERLNGEVGASRAAVDSGWIDTEHQVGQTGKTVRPKLYIACGISGAIQHQAGMAGSQCVVAINKNPDAAMMQMANYALCSDAMSIIPMLIDEIKKQNVLA